MHKLLTWCKILQIYKIFLIAECLLNCRMAIDIASNINLF
jgi:hypothetical protein